MINQWIYLKIESEEKDRIIVTGLQVFGIPAENAYFSFKNDGRIMTHVRVQVDKKHQEALLEKLKKQYGNPVDSYRQGDVFYFAKTAFEKSPNLLGHEEVVEGKNWVWHQQKPLAETWTKEEKEKFRSVILSIFDREGKKREGEDEDWNTFFENVWGQVIRLTNVEDLEYLQLTWESIYIPEVVEK